MTFFISFCARFLRDVEGVDTKIIKNLIINLFENDVKI